MTRVSVAGAIACGILLAYANGSQQGPRRKSPQGKEASAVPSLELRIQPVDREILHGESLDVHVSLTNRGDAAAQAPKPDLGCPFVFNFMSPGDDTVLHSFSEMGYRVALSPSRIVAAPAPMVALAPGQTLAYETDLGRLMTELVLPGRYRVKASYVVGGVQLESPAVELTIIAPQVMALAELVAAQGNRLITVFGLRNKDGARSLMQRESAGGAPTLGAAFRRGALPASVTPGSLAIAVDMSEAPRGSWFAWLEGERIGACYGWGRDLVSMAPAVPVGLASPRLIEAGRRLPDGRAAFLVAGLEGQEVKIKEFTYRYVPVYQGEGPPPPPPPGEEAAENSQRPNPEIRMLAFGGSSPPQRILARYVPRGDDPGIELAWAATEAGETRVFTRRYGAGDTKRLYARREPLAALEMNPEGGEGAPAVIDALFGPSGAGEQRHMTFVRIPLDGTGQAVEWTFREPTRLGSANTVKFPDRWAIAPVALENPPVLARVETDLVCLWPSLGGTQQTVAEGTAGKVEFIRLAALPRVGRNKKRVWATWVDPERGIERRPIR